MRQTDIGLAAGTSHNKAGRTTASAPAHTHKVAVGTQQENENEKLRMVSYCISPVAAFQRLRRPEQSRTSRSVHDDNRLKLVGA